MLTRAVVVTGVDGVEIQSVDVPSPENGEVLVEIESSVISPGTELRCLRGTQSGLPNGPFIPGYAAAGRVVETGKGAEEWTGKRVFVRSTARASVALCWGGHVGHAVASAATVMELPEPIETVAAPLARLFAIAHRGVALTRPGLGTVVGVVGLGVIGQCSARLFHAAGCRVVGVDTVSARAEALRQAGVDAVVAEGLASESLRRVFPSGVDILVDATGSETVLSDAVGALRSKPWNDAATPSAQLVIQGSYPGRFALEYGALFLPEATVHFPRDCTDSDMRIVLDQMARRRIEYRDLLTWTGPPDEAATIYRRLANREPGLLTGAFVWSEG